MDEPGSDLRAEWAQGRSICVHPLCIWDRIGYVFFMNLCVKFVCVGLPVMDPIQTCMQDWHKEDTCSLSAFVFVSVLVFTYLLLLQ